MSILDLRTDDSLASAPGYMRPRKPVAPMSWGGLFSAPFLGIGEAGAQVWASALEVATSYGDIMARVDDGRSLTDRDMLVETDISKAMREAGRSLRPDPETASTAEQIIYGFARGATKVVGGSILAGPFGAVGAGVEEGISAADDLKREGVDLVTRMQAGGVQGAGMALAALPLLGTTIGKTAALYVAGGPGGFIAQQALTREILQGAGYDKLGDSYDPFDPVGLAVSSLIPAVFTAAGLRAGAKRARVSKEVSDAARVAYEIEQRNATSPVSRDDFAAVAKHAEALAKAEEQVARGEPVQVSDVAPRIETLAEFSARAKVPDAPPPPDVPGDFLAWVRDSGGIEISQKLDITGDANNVRNNPAGIFRQGGNATDTLAEMAIQRGYLAEGADSSALVDLVQKAVRGERVLDFEQQMRAADRARAESDLASRLQDAEAKLKLLGEDASQARGNVALMEAYLREAGPRLLGAALDEARAVDNARPEVDALREKAQQIVRDMEDGGRDIEAYERDVEPLSPVMRRLVEQEGKAAGANVGTPRDLQAEMISLRKSQAVLNRLLECIG